MKVIYDPVSSRLIFGDWNWDQFEGIISQETGKANCLCTTRGFIDRWEFYFAQLKPLETEIRIYALLDEKDMKR